jgi:hypothetical protein
MAVGTYSDGSTADVTTGAIDSAAAGVTVNAAFPSTDPE